MTRDLISKRTRNEFREFLVGWTLREIEVEFDGANIECDRTYQPPLSGERRSSVEQYYRTLDFTKPADARRLLAAYGSIIGRKERNLSTTHGREEVEQSIAQLKACLAKDGFAYADGSIVGTKPETRTVLEGARMLSRVTRRAIFDHLTQRDVHWSGRLEEPEFLERMCDPDNPKHRSAIGGAWQHRVRNADWYPDWIFSDTDIGLLDCSDHFFLSFLRDMVHPEVRPDSDEARELTAAFNSRLAVDGWELVEGRPISGKPTFVARKLVSGAVALPDPVHATDVLSDEYVRELSGKCDSRLALEDLDGAVTVARTLLEAILSELEVRLAEAKGKYKGDLPKQFKHVTKLLRMDDQRPDLDDRFKDVIRGLVMVANGLAPLRNKMSDGHARERKPALHHARVVVNAAKTVTALLVESYAYQLERGLIRDISTSAKEAIP